MSNAKEIRTQIKSIQSTQKITKAMEMVAASKMRHAQLRMEATRPYAEKMSQVIGHVAHANSEYKHAVLTPRETVKRAGLIVVSTDRGLCGGLNINLFKRAVSEIKQLSEQNIDVDVVTIGKKAAEFFKRIGVKSIANVAELGDTVHLEDFIGSIKVALDAYSDGQIDKIYLVHNKFVNTMTQSPEAIQLVPLVPSEEEELRQHWDYIYEPEAKTVLDHLLVRYIESLVYQGVVENIACEMAARMVAMKSASENAGELIDDLQLVYNKARQASITQELAEIVGGAAAV